MKIILLSIILAVLIHPVFAQGSDSDDDSTGNVSSEMISTDGTIKIEMNASMPKTGSVLLINLRFIDASTGNNLQNVNYDLVALQNGEPVLSQLGLYSQNGIAQHTTSVLSTDNHVEIMVILQGIGENAPYHGPQGEVFETKVVPEFGALSFLVLCLAAIPLVLARKLFGTKRI